MFQRSLKTLGRSTPVMVAALVAAGGWIWSVAPAAANPDMAAQMAKMPPAMRQMVQSYSPEMRAKVMALSPKVRNELARIQGQHTRMSKEVTMRQVMQEILTEYQSMVIGIAVENREQVSDSARRLADHRIPVGGLLVYLPLDKINDGNVGALTSINATVEGNSIKIAEAAESGNMAKAATYLDDVLGGCVACHQIFRGKPGVSEHLMMPKHK